MRSSLWKVLKKTETLYRSPPSIANINNVKLCASWNGEGVVQVETESALRCPNNTAKRTFGSRSRGSRGHGWLTNYRAGKGGRHLQGRYHNRNVEELTSINDSIFELGSSDLYLDIEVDGKGDNEKQRKRIVIELASKALPKTCENFIKLCQDGYYNDTKVFKIEKKVGICMGDTLGMDGNGGRCHPEISSYGRFESEAFVISHTHKGILTMLAPGIDKNDSRFCITLDDAPQLDGKFVAFGRVKSDNDEEPGIEALENIVENTYTKKGKPQRDITIKAGGLM